MNLPRAILVTFGALALSATLEGAHGAERPARKGATPSKETPAAKPAPVVATPTPSPRPTQPYLEEGCPPCGRG